MKEHDDNSGFGVIWPALRVQADPPAVPESWCLKRCCWYTCCNHSIDFVLVHHVLLHAADSVNGRVAEPHTSQSDKSFLQTL